MNKFGVWRPGKTGTHFALSTIREAVWCGQSHRYNTYGLHRLWFVVVVLVNGIESTPKGSISSFAGLTGSGLGWLLLILSLIFYFIILFVEWWVVSACVCMCLCVFHFPVRSHLYAFQHFVSISLALSGVVIFDLIIGLFVARLSWLAFTPFSHVYSIGSPRSAETHLLNIPNLWSNEVHGEPIERSTLYGKTNGVHLPYHTHLVCDAIGVCMKCIKRKLIATIKGTEHQSRSTFQKQKNEIYKYIYLCV